MNIKKMVTISILGELLDGKEPITDDYEKGGLLKEGEFIQLVKEMQDKGLIKGVGFAQAGSRLIIAFFNTAEITEYGKGYYDREISKL
ncbi:hypothetical protein [Priestia koreensis]|uniref:Uncharacterized protein n=1 Tax=Priestia koreensis TaxID=284581 RepID=A0A0M0L5P3_9BACI|nr:hypothetical protein [Priestia koreensis]KOO46405.1 hypothetical protein AMD01_11265 [Priestia koreensis]